MAAKSETSLGRGLDVLMALGSGDAVADGGLGVVRIAKLVGREKTQVSRALRTLADAGLVDRDPETLDYRLGWRLFTLAARAGDRRLLSVAPPILRQLVSRLGETAHLSVLEGADVLTVLSEPSPSAVRATDWSGRRAPAWCTSSGRVLLFDRDRAALGRLFAETRLRPLGPRAPRDVDDLHRRIAAARAIGYAIADEEFEPGLVGAAAPVRDFRGRIVAALNVSGPKFRFGPLLESAGGPETRRAADELSARLGWKDENGEGQRSDHG